MSFLDSDLHSNLCQFSDDGIFGWGRRGFTRQPESPNVHISGPRRFKHHQNSTQGPQERERRMKIVAEEGKRSAKFWASTLRAPHPSGLHPSVLQPSGPTLRGPTITRFGPPPFGAHPSKAPVVPKFNIPKLAEVEIGRSRNWPKSKLAEVEIGRSRSRSSHHPGVSGVQTFFLGEWRRGLVGGTRACANCSPTKKNKCDPTVA